MAEYFEIIVIGGGHAGIEAAHAAAKMGCKTALVTMDLRAIGRMSCNPAIGGVAKGQLVREIDALGGLMGVLSDLAGIQFRMLNRSKGPAVWGPRAQMDMYLYADTVQRILKGFPGLTLIQAHLQEVRSVPGGSWRLGLHDGSSLRCRSVIIASGTFLKSVMFTGLSSTPGGRVGEPSSDRLAEDLASMGIPTRRLKTGTPARLSRQSIDFSRCTVQAGDISPSPFSFYRSPPAIRNDAVCWITHTSEKTHDVLRAGFSESPLFNGAIRGIGPRYCPSIETKIERFADRDRHQLFLEPEGIRSERIYVNGFSSSLPARVQEAALKTIPGLENCRIMQMGYAVEYDAIAASRLHLSYESKDFPGLYFAGQVNGTSGYEEAAAQGLMAGINAALKLTERPPFILARSDAYIGVMTEDLTTLEIDEPYRMFTSRAEYRLFLRQDNADMRLSEKAARIGMLSISEREAFEASAARRTIVRETLESLKIRPEQINPLLVRLGRTEIPESERAVHLMRRPEITLEDIEQVLGQRFNLTADERQYISSEILYAGYFGRQEAEIERSRRLAGMAIPPNFDYKSAKAMRTEARQKLSEARPQTVSAAARIPGVSPADISGLIFHIKSERAN